MGVCNKKKIKKNIMRCGEKSLSKGVKETIRIGMKDDQEIAFTLDEENSTICTGIALKDGEKFFQYEGNNYSNDPSVAFAETEYDKTFPQQIVFMLFSNSPATKAEVEALFTRKDLVMITERVGGDAEIYGFDGGLKPIQFKYRPNDEDKGAFVITLNGADETSLPKTLIHKTVGGVVDTKAFLATITEPDEEE